jgi:hypothetical protein
MTMSSQFKTYDVEYLGEQVAYPNPKPGPGRLWHSNGMWYLSCPRCSNAMLLQHTIITPSLGVTIIPSVGCSQCKAHFRVKEGKIKRLKDMRR